MSKSNGTDEGSIRPDSGAFDDERRSLHVDVGSRRRSSVTDCSEDSQTSPPASKKARILTSLAKEDVLSTVKKAVMGSGISVSEKQQQLSRMIAELQSLQQNLGGNGKVSSQ